MGAGLRRLCDRCGRERCGCRRAAEEVVDHAVGIGMVDIEAVEFAIGWQVDTGLALDVEDYARGIGAGLFTGQRGEPVGDRIGADGSGEDQLFRFSHSAL